MTAGAAHRTERLMCLVFILKARGRRGITRAELKGAIEDYAACPTEQAFERMLERDKRDLRDAGVAIEVLQRDAWHEDEHAYVLAQHALATLPQFTPAELRVLGQAAEAWERSSWKSQATGALHKLEVFGSEFVSEHHGRISFRGDQHLSVLRSAIRERTSVRFHYRRPGDVEATVRHVEPWGLIHRDGGWYCVAHDLDRNAPRIFRTSRISGEIEFDIPATVTVDPTWASLLDAYFRNLKPMHVELLVAPEHGWVWRSQGTITGHRTIGGRNFELVELELKERDGLIGALAASAPNVMVVEPADLRLRVIEHLQEVARG